MAFIRRLTTIAALPIGLGLGLVGGGNVAYYTQPTTPARACLLTA